VIALLHVLKTVIAEANIVVCQLDVYGSHAIMIRAQCRQILTETLLIELNTLFPAFLNCSHITERE
jgi:hypothetical protein